MTTTTTAPQHPQPPLRAAAHGVGMGATSKQQVHGNDNGMMEQQDTREMRGTQ